MLAAPAVGLVLAVLVCLTKTPLFESTAVILVDSGFDEIVQFETVENRKDSGLEALKSLEMTILADSVVLRVLDRLRLREESGFLPKSLAGDPSPPDAKLLKFLREKRIRTTLVPETRLIEIAVLDPAPERAQRIAQALSTEFETFLVEERRSEGNKARHALEAQAEEARSAALQAEELLESFRREHSEFPVEQDHDFLAARLTQFGDELNAVKRLRVQLESQKKALDEIDSETAPLDVIEVAQYKGMGHVTDLLSALSVSRARFSVAQKHYTSRHPAYQSAEAEALHNEALLGQLAQDIKSAVTANYLSAKQQEEILSDELAQVKSQFNEMKSASSSFRALKEQAERSWLLHQTLQNRLSETIVASDLVSNIATVLSESMLPYKKAKPSLLFHGIVGGALGSMLSGIGLLVVVLVGLPFSHRKQLEQRLGLPVIADWSDSRKTGDPTQSIGLLQYIGGNRDKMILVTAPQIERLGESVAFEIARAASANGRRTLLILVKPGRDDISVRSTAHPNLFLLEVTPETVRNHARFPSGLRQLKNDFDNIFVEAGGARDVELENFLSSLTDQDVVVVGRGVARKQLIEERVMRLTKPGAPPIALIIAPPSLSDPD